MTQRLGQRLVNYIRKSRGYEDGEALRWTEEDVIRYQASIERKIFNMTDAEFMVAIKDDIQ